MTLLDASKTNPLQGGPSFSLRHRVLRVAWGVVWFVCARFTPAPLHRWRVWILRCFGARVHPTARIYGSARVWYPPNLMMEAHAVLGPRSNCYCMDIVRIGKKAVVSQGAVLCAGTHDISDPNFQLVVKPIDVGDFAWVAAEAFVGPGVSIGRGAVVGARGVMFRDAVPLGVYVGNPASLLKHRTLTNKKSTDDLQ